MTADLSPDERFAVQRPAVVRTQAKTAPATCTSIGLSGGFLTCDWAPELGAVLEIAIQPRRASRDDIELQGRVVMLSRAGGPERRGFGVRWLLSESAQGNVKCLEILVNWARNMAARGSLDTGSRIADTVLDPLVDGDDPGRAPTQR